MRRFALFFAAVWLLANACAAQTPSLESIHQLYDRRQFAEIVRLVPRSPENSPDLDFYLGMALAQLHRWPEAKSALQAGRRKAPRDERFPVELAGVAYRMNDLGEAESDLRHALHFNPRDSYALNFLATIYLLHGNVRAALKYWNRIEAPRISQIEEIPRPQVRQRLLDRAITISPLSVLPLRSFETTDAELAALGIFPLRRWELQPDGAVGDYNLVLHSVGDNGWGANKWTAALSALRGLPYETVYPQYRNAWHSAVNFDGIVRWDSQKRRLFASVSMPLHSDPKWRLRAYADGRDENWDLANSLHGGFASPLVMKLRKIEFGAELYRIQNGRWSWNTGASFSRRTFANLADLTPQTSSFFDGGDALEWSAGSDYRLLSIPDRRFTIDSSGTAGVGRFFASGGSNRFERAEGSLRLQWFPRAEGDDFEIATQWRAGALFGSVPFDELYTLGVERDDNDLWLRGISATSDGRKGNSPVGRRYLLWNWEWSKIIYRDAFFELKAGPALDAGEISDASGAFGSNGWLWDPGAQLTVRVLDTVNVVFSYGHDMRSGQNTFFGAALP